MIVDVRRSYTACTCMMMMRGPYTVDRRKRIHASSFVYEMMHLCVLNWEATVPPPTLSAWALSYNWWFVHIRCMYTSILMHVRIRMRTYTIINNNKRDVIILQFLYYTKILVCRMMREDQYLIKDDDIVLITAYLWVYVTISFLIWISRLCTMRQKIHLWIQIRSTFYCLIWISHTYTQHKTICRKEYPVIFKGRCPDTIVHATHTHTHTQYKKLFCVYVNMR